MPESVRWMFSRGQSEDVRGQLKYIIEVNKIEGADDLADRQLVCFSLFLSLFRIE